MKQKLLAICLLIIIVSFVVINTLILQNIADKTLDEVEKLSVNDERAFDKLVQIDKNFSNKESYISMTVSHDDLTNIEDSFAELAGYLFVGDTNGAEVAKCRLLRFLEHFRRLIGFNIESII